MHPQEILSRYEFRKRYAGIPENRPASHIDPEDVPTELRSLIPIAEKWGIIEEGWVPQNVIREVPKYELEHLIKTVSPLITNRENDPFDKWLSGSEAAGPTWTVAYLAFSELRIVFEDAQWVLEHWQEINSNRDSVDE